MANYTIFVKKNQITRYPYKDAKYGYECSVWECLRCKAKTEIPYQQVFRYCPHCGSKIVQTIRKAGNYENIRSKTKVRFVGIG